MQDGNHEGQDEERLRTFSEEERRRDYGWLLLIPVLALGYLFYTQFDRVRGKLDASMGRQDAPVVGTAKVPPPRTLRAEPAPRPSVHRVITAVKPSAPPVQAAPVPPPATTPPPQRAFSPTSPESMPLPLPGKAGLVEALRRGDLRLATAHDMGRWKTSHARSAGGHPGRSFDEYAGRMQTYVVQKDFHIPGELSGSNAVVFLLEPRTPFPRGDAGHSPILDIESGTCIGALCRMLLPED